MQCWSQLLPVTETKIRLQKVLAAAGIGSRRACEALIDQGRVSINGETVTGQGRRVDPEVDVIHVDGERLQTKACPDHDGGRPGETLRWRLRY